MRQFFNIRSSQTGFALMEILVATGLFGIVGLSLAFSAMAMLDSRGRVLHNSLASQLAIEGLEQFAGIDPTSLDSSDNTNGYITREGIRFRRSISVTVNVDNSRTIAVAVTCPSCKLGGEASVTENVPLWRSA